MSVALSEKKTRNAVNKKKEKNGIDKVLEHWAFRSRMTMKTLSDKGYGRSCEQVKVSKIKDRTSDVRLKVLRNH